MYAVRFIEDVHSLQPCTWLLATSAIRFIAASYLVEFEQNLIGRNGGLPISKSNMCCPPFRLISPNERINMNKITITHESNVVTIPVTLSYISSAGHRVTRKAGTKQKYESLGLVI